MSRSKNRKEDRSELAPCIAQKSKFGHAKSAAAAGHYALGKLAFENHRPADTLHINALFDKKGVRDDPITIFIKEMCHPGVSPAK